MMELPVCNPHRSIRVVPGNLGLAVSNGHPCFLLPGRHLIVDPLFTYMSQVCNWC